MDETNSRKIPQGSNAAGAVIIFFVLLFAFSKWGPAVPFSVMTQPKGEPMVVSAEGKATAIPDVANVSAGIEESGASLAKVQENANKKSQKLVDSLKDMGVNEKDIKTTAYNVYPEMDYDNSPPTVSGYRVSINYVVKVRDIDKVNEILTTVTGSGANLVGGVSFDLSDESRLKAAEEARTDAVEKAKNNAQSLAKVSGVTLGRIINISESFSGGFPRPMYAMDAKVVGMGGDGLQNGNPEVQPGTTEVNITVSLSYEVR